MSRLVDFVRTPPHSVGMLLASQQRACLLLGRGLQKSARRRAAVESVSAMLTRATAMQLKGDEASLASAEALATAAFGRLDAAEHRARVDVASFLGKLTQLRGRYPDAEAHFRAALASSRETDDAAEQFVLRTHVASAEERQGKHDDAEANYATALDGLARHAGWSNGRTYHAAFSLAALLRGRARHADAEALLRRAGCELGGAFGEGDARVLLNQVTLAEVLLDQPDRADDARAILGTVLDQLDPRHPSYRRAFDMHEELLEDARAAEVEAPMSFFEFYHQHPYACYVENGDMDMDAIRFDYEQLHGKHKK